MSKKVISIETGIWWTKVAVVDVNRKSQQVYDAFSFKTPENAIEDGYIRDKEGFANCLKEELAKRQIIEKNVIFSINSSKVITREVCIPSVKDKLIGEIVETHAKEYFPMDVSNYTFSYQKMDVVSNEEGNQIKLLLMAIPDNLLSNYCSFADVAGLTIEAFEYIGNSAVSFINNHFAENAVIVQIEEQSTIISMVSDKKIVFQRITPYGYGTSIAAVLEHSVLGVKDEYEAADFLMTHDVLYDMPDVSEFEASGIEDLERRREVLEEAYSGIKDALSYHIRVVYTALDYYKNQTKGEFSGKLHLIGDGVQFAGMKKMFQAEIPLQFEEIDYYSLINRSKSGLTLGNPLETRLVSYLSVIGAAINPVKITPKEWSEKDNKKSTLQSAYVILAAVGLISVVLILVGTIRQFAAVTEQKKLDTRIAELSYVQAIYDENAEVSAKAAQFEAFDKITETQNEKLAELITSLENELPNSMTVQSVVIVEDSITLNVTCDKKLTAAQMLLNFQNIPFLGNISIPSMAESEDASGDTIWQFSVLANYVETQTDASDSQAEILESEDVQEGGTENEEN